MAISFNNGRYTISGKINNQGGNKLTNFVVRAYVKNLLSTDDVLGSTLSGIDGSFSIGFSEKKYEKPGFLDETADIYFEVSYCEEVLLNTRSTVMRNAQVNTDATELTISFADLIKPPHKLFKAKTLGAAPGSETGYLDSNLSAPQFGYDLVVGTTARSINATMKGFLQRLNTGIPTEIWYQQETAGSPIIPMNPMVDVDPFSVIDGGTPPDVIKNSNFAFAIKAQFGLPKGVDLLSLKDIIILDQGKQMVTYQLYFHTLEIVSLQWGNRGSYAWKHITQPEGNPYVFKFNVHMNFDALDPSSALGKLPENIKKILNNLGPDMFGIQQLWLDLNNAGLQDSPVIEDIPATDPLYITLQSDFINTYWSKISKTGEFILGYAVKHAQVTTPATTIQPTSLDFEVIPHYDTNGNKTNQYDLYSLNYLTMVENRKMPPVTEFNWNWITTDEAPHMDGAMAIRREIFANYLSKSLNKFLAPVCIKPNVTFEMPSIFSWKCSYSLPSDPVGANFAYTPAIGTKLLALSYYQQASQSDSAGLQHGHLTLVSELTGTVSVQGSEITLELNASLHVDFDCGDLGFCAITGQVGGYSSTSVYVIAVDGSGKLQVNMKSGYPQSGTTGPSLSEGAFAGIDGMIKVSDKLAAHYASMSSNLVNYASDVAAFLNSTGNMWVFPGATTFLFKDGSFSSNQDLVTHLTYSLPNNG
jgi:hypothetical protein